MGLGTFLKLFFPERCKGCGTLDTSLCSSCIAKIPLALDLDTPHSYAVFDYGNRIVRTAIRELKYHRRNETARTLAHASIPHIIDFLSSEIQGVHEECLTLVPIPQHPSKTRLRGFNQSEQLALWWQKELEGATVTKLLEKTTMTIPQALMKNRTARLLNLNHSMHCKLHLNPKDIYIVIDDVTTTGATFTEASRALRSAGAKKIITLALAHGYARM